MDLGLKNKVALVCGSSKGLGKTTAQCLAQEGTSVMVTFLASEKASYVTGMSITVDGGWVRSLI